MFREEGGRGSVTVARTPPLVASRPPRTKTLAAWLPCTYGKALNRLLVERESGAEMRELQGGKCLTGL